MAAPLASPPDGDPERRGASARPREFGLDHPVPPARRRRLRSASVAALLVQRAVHTRSARAAVVVALVVSGLWLLVSRQPTYDPYAWLIWGRQIGDGTLDTVAGPSWKPLPVMLSTPFSWLGHYAAAILSVVL